MALGVKKVSLAKSGVLVPLSLLSTNSILSALSAASIVFISHMSSAKPNGLPSNHHFYLNNYRAIVMYKTKQKRQRDHARRLCHYHPGKNYWAIFWAGAAKPPYYSRHRHLYRFLKSFLDIPMLSREFESIETVIPDGSKKQMFI